MPVLNKFSEVVEEDAVVEEPEVSRYCSSKRIN